MSPEKTDHTWSNSNLDSHIAECVARALRAEHSDTVSAMKHISLVTGISSLTIRKWYRGEHPPKTAHLLLLMRYYPKVLEAVCSIIGREDLWFAGAAFEVPERMQRQLHKSRKKYQSKDDKGGFQPMSPVMEDDLLLNERQQWFVEKLKAFEPVQAASIVKHWHVTLRTARRDIEGLMRVDVIQSMRDGKRSWYEITGSALF